MNFARLSAWILSSESAGELRAGEGVVLGRHEPRPLPGAVVRRYDTEAGAGAYGFRTLGDVVAERHWGEGWAAANAERVRRGSLLRSAALLAAAGWDVPAVPSLSRVMIVSPSAAILGIQTSYGVAVSTIEQAGRLGNRDLRPLSPGKVTSGRTWIRTRASPSESASR